jgi:hypothetical protein
MLRNLEETKLLSLQETIARTHRWRPHHALGTMLSTLRALPYSILTKSQGIGAFLMSILEKSAKKHLPQTHATQYKRPSYGPQLLCPSSNQTQSCTAWDLAKRTLSGNKQKRFVLISEIPDNTLKMMQNYQPLNEWLTSHPHQPHLQFPQGSRACSVANITLNLQMETSLGWNNDNS